MIISVSNQKGGVGKTTTVQGVSASLKSRGYKVLMIDLDPQGNLSDAVKSDNKNNTIYEVMKKEVSINDAIQHTDSGDIIPSNILLSAAEMEFTKLGREKLLFECFQELNIKYDYIIIDTPPALSILTINAFTASNNIIIPMEADMFSLLGLGQLNTTIAQVIKYSNKDLKVAGILLTKHDTRTLLSQAVTDKINAYANNLNTIVFKTFIRKSVSIREAQISQSNIIDYSPKANAQTDYVTFVDEFLERI